MNLRTAISNGLTAFARLTGLDVNHGGRNVYFHDFGIHITHEQALRLSAVWACVNVISKSLAASRWEVFQESANGDREVRRNTTTYKLLNVRPNEEMTSFAFHEAALIVALIFGDFFAEIDMDIAGRPAALWPLSPERCNLERNDAGERVLRVINYGEADTYLPYNQVYHIHGPGIDGLCGFDVVALASRTIAHGLAAEQFGQKFYENGTQMGGVIELPPGSNGKQAQDMRESVNQRHQGSAKAFNNLILYGGAKWHESSVDPDKAQFIETRYLIVEEVCRWFGTPPHKIAHLLRSTFSNIEHQGLEFVRDALTPWAERCAQEADYKLLPDQGRFKVRIDTDWLAEGDAMSKANTDAILVRNGLARRNEVRKRRGQNTLGPLGDILTVEAALTTLENLEAEPAPAAPTAPGPRRLPAPKEPQTEAARALYAAALKRCLIRYHHRAVDAQSHATNPKDLQQRLSSLKSDHVLHVREQIGEVHSVLRSVGVSVDESAVMDAVNRFITENGNLVQRASESGDTAVWCDPEARADEVAIEFTEIAKGVRV